jgi:hypothetical protein
MASPQSASRQPMSPGHRNAWILTAYGIFGLGLLCAIAYTVAQYAVQ